jgi:tetratricopeptide (TPR) repeat protein
VHMKLTNDALFKKAHELFVSNQDINEAETIFNIFFDLDRDSEVLLFYLAAVQMKKRHYALAAILFREVIKRQPKFIEAINNLGYCLKETTQIKEARDAFKESAELSLKSDLDAKEKANYLSNLGSTYIANGTPEKAIEILDKALTFNPDDIESNWNRGLAYLEKGDYVKGFKGYEWGKRIESTKNRNYSKEGITQFWDGTKGKVVAVFGEQGIGDEIMFASMLPDLMNDCKLVILDAHPRLMDIFRRSFPDIPVYGTRKDKEFVWPPFHPNIDAKLSIGSLGKFYRKSAEDFPRKPYLKADPVIVAKYRDRLASMSDKPKIGISWKGGTKLTGVNNRFIKLDSWLPIFESVDADFISLQYSDDAEKHVTKFEEKYPHEIHHWPDTLADYDETAGLVMNLDLIISVPQSVVHLAGALGTPTWQLCPKKALWQMGAYGQDMPWYYCVKNFWQDEGEDWQTVINTVANELCTLQTTIES